MLNLLAIIEGMEAQGADPAAILHAVKALAKTEALAGAQIEDQRALNRARQARWRNAQKEKRSANVSITSHNVTEASPPPSSLFPSPTPPSKNPSPSTPSEKDGRERATRLPDGWSVPAEWREWAESEIGPEGQQLSRSRIDVEAAKFPDHWRSQPGKGGTKTNWKATWRNWIRNALSRASTPTKADRRQQDTGAAPRFKVIEIDGRLVKQRVAA